MRLARIAIVALLVIVLVTSIACSSSTSNPTAMPTSKSLVLFSDDFSDPNSGWDVSENSAGQVAYKNGHYSIKTYLSSPYCTYGEINRYFSDFILEEIGRASCRERV